MSLAHKVFSPVATNVHLRNSYYYTPNTMVSTDDFWNKESESPSLLNLLYALDFYVAQDVSVAGDGVKDEVGMPEVHPELETFTKLDMMNFPIDPPQDPVMNQFKAFRNAIIRVWHLVKSYAKTGYNPWDGTDGLKSEALSVLD